MLAALARRLGLRRLAGLLDRPILLPTSVSREVEWLIVTDLFELPFLQGERESTRDALAESIIATPAIEAAIPGHGPAFRERLTVAMKTYGATRVAAAEITTGLISLGTGALALNKLTPGAASLGPALAAIVAQQSAVAAIPRRGGRGGLRVGRFTVSPQLGRIWYGLFPVSPKLGLVAATTTSLMAALAIFAAFAGLVFDPIQRALGLHQARLLRMVEALERSFFDPNSKGFAVHDHYVARLLDVLDFVGAAGRL